MDNTTLSKRSLLANSLPVGCGTLGIASLANSAPTTGAATKVLDTFSMLGSTTAVAGDIAQIKGHTAPGLGSGEFIAKSGTVPNDGGTKINSTTSGVYWQRYNVDQITPQMFGARGDGTTDDTSAFNSAIAYLASIAGGTLHIPASPTPYKISSTLTISDSNIFLIGDGCSRYHDGGTPKYATRLQWYGGASPILQFITPTGITNSIRTGGGAKGFDIKGRGIVTIGLNITSWRGGIFEDIFAFNVTQTSFQTNCHNSSLLSEPADTQFCRFSRLSWRNIDSSAVYNANGVVVSGSIDTLANTSFNIFEGCVGQNLYGIGWLIPNADNNQFIGCTVIRVNTSTPGLEIRGPADANHFIDFSVGGANGIFIKGTASGYSHNPVRNTFYAMDEANGTGYPTLDSGCRISWHSDGGYWQNLRIATAVIGQDSTQTNSEIPRVTNESLRLRNSASNHARITDGTMNGVLI